MDSDDENDLMAIRAKNIENINNMFGPMFNECQQICETMNKDANVFHTPKQRQKRSIDDLYQFTGYIPTERRKSARLANCQPQYKFEDLDDDKVDSKDQDYFYDLEEIVNPLRRSRIRGYSNRSTVSPITKMPEEISNSELNNIAQRSGNKTYSVNGTSCHQCRQKTIDTKTVCRSGRCIGVRGYFCGPCLKNRYGESAREALLDPGWSCPPCRDLCNCSICRTRQGKRPTGILAPTVQQEGYSSVKDFLLTLAEKGFLSKQNKFNTSPNKKNMDYLYKTESSHSVIDALIHQYVKKMLDIEMKYVPSGYEARSDLLGFTGGMPVVATSEINNGDLYGFGKDASYCILGNDVLYLYVLFK